MKKGLNLCGAQEAQGLVRRSVALGGFEPYLRFLIPAALKIFNK